MDPAASRAHWRGYAAFSTEGASSVVYDLCCRWCGKTVAHLKCWPEPGESVNFHEIVRPVVEHPECAAREAPDER
jgi:hypothetical protein